MDDTADKIANILYGLHKINQDKKQWLKPQPEKQDIVTDLTPEQFRGNN